MTVREAPYPSDIKARGWRCELDMEQVRQSDTWALAAPATRPWLLMLWVTAWEQVPCGSLPAEDELIAARIGMDAKAFAKAKAVLLRRWWPAADGRLYHDTIVDRVLNMAAKRAKDAGRTARHRANRTDSQQSNAGHTNDTTVSNASVTRDTTVSNEGVRSEFDTQNPEPRTLRSKSNALSGSASPAPDLERSGPKNPAPPPRMVNGSAKAAAERVLQFLNEKTGKHFRPMPGTLEPILARLKDGATESECRKVIANRCRHWLTNDEMRGYLRPETLCNRTKFAQYLGELGAPAPETTSEH